ncbi:uncharacterized protein yc1106_05120 [Curvularia clavata]|uniref:VLRF1 domain-containing protein n=1 Tax=Curvularia clavata TaxID=95742 RepID=A0A9Q8Z7I9_CURCL|nr:uncharacterized protein yc1106_05120 [Curvularia clavata]
MTVKSICAPPSDYSTREDAHIPSLRAYQKYIQDLCFRNPSLSTFSSFLVKPDTRKFVCRATALEFRAGVTGPNIRFIPDIDCLHSELRRAVNNETEKSNDQSNLAIQGRILLIEDLTAEMITVLGAELDIDPLFLATHLHTVHRTGMYHQTPDDANLPSRLHQSGYVNISYHQSVTCNDIFPSGARFMTDTAINRKLVFLRATKIGLAQRRVSIIKLKQEGGIWLALVLVDPPLGDTFYRGGDHLDAGKKVKLKLQPYMGTYEDFMKMPPFSQSYKVPQRHGQSGMLGDLIQYWERAIPKCFDPVDPSIQSLAYYPLRIVAAQWVKYVAVMLHCLKLYEYGGDRLDLKRFDMDIRELHGWRRRSMVSQQKIQAVIRHLKTHTSAQPEHRADVDLVLEDFEAINKNIEDAGHRLENMLPVVTSLVQILDARRSFAETENIGRLTILALIFVPLTYISSLFSMNATNLPGSPHFWVYFAVAIPVTLMVLLIARPPTKERLQQIPGRVRTAYQSVRLQVLTANPRELFDLPEELLATLTLKDQPERLLPETQSPAPETTTESPSKADSDDSSPARATSCNLCGLSFTSLADQRSHVRSDLHGYNLKQKIKGAKPVSETEFEKLIGDLDESISGSESSESEVDEEEDGSKGKDSTLSALLKKQAKIADPGFDEFTSSKKQIGPGKPPLLWFTSPSIPDNMSLGIYRAIFTNSEQEEESHIIENIKRKQLSPKQPPKIKANEGGVPLPDTDIGPHYFLCMIGGGHFAAMIVALAPKTGKKHTGADERSATVIAHKTFHRYTTRRKQGGSQSANDNAKGNAHSAGSSIRRYNETALVNEVRELLNSWKSMIDTAELIFVRATGSTNRRTLFGPYEGQVLRNNDPRNRGFPFSTRRATQKELMRAFVELTRVKQSTVDEAALAALNASQNEATATATTPAKPKPKKPTKEEEAASLHTSQIIPMIKRSKVPALMNYIQTNNIPPTFTFLPANHHTPTPLHLAASLNSALIVLVLLTKAGADPTLMNDDARTPFTLAGDRATRDAFRVARSQLGESAWDWEKAGVPPAMTKAEADKRHAEEQDAKAAENKAEADRRKAETERVRKESEAEEVRRKEQRLGKGKALGALPVRTAADLREEEMRGLTPEARARMERERRARAAEERLRRMQG